ncbi:hypothetical protein lerEdw1_007403 [Lerista edwardsae]|nr:hypothetical protein lerEdw1_007403 [Lerista edwardsae]
MANQAVVLMPTNGTQPGQGIAGPMIQSPGMVTYAGQQLEDMSNQTQQMRALDRFFKAETKTLGAIQILIGLIHFGLGPLPLIFYEAVRFGHFLFWTGLFFITSGSISVSAENQKNINLVRCSVGFNILSAIMALISSIAHAIDLVVISLQVNPYSVFWQTGLSVLFLLFTLLEFCITVSTAHFGCLATCCSVDTRYVNFTAVSRREETLAQGDLRPPSYDGLAFSPKRQAE